MLRLEAPLLRFLGEWCSQNHPLRSGVNVVLNCKTQVDVPGVGKVRNHPDYRGDGPVKDWITILIPDAPTQDSTLQRSVLAQFLTLISGIDGIDLEEPLVVVRLCAERSKTDALADTTLMKRHRKEYIGAGNSAVPHFSVVPQSLILSRELVMEDFPFLYENVSGFEAAKQVPLRQRTYVVGATEDNEDRVNRRDWKPGLVDGKDLLDHDYAYSVLPFDEWAPEFADLYCFRRGQ